jgi:hypothetical protein
MNAICATAIVCVIICAGGVRSESDRAVDKSILDVLRVVEDPDGNTNVRSGPSLKSDVTGKVPSGSIVTVEETKGDWTKVGGLPATNKPRYIHSSRLRKIDKWKQIPGRESKDKKSATAKHENAEVKVQTAPFTASEHKVAKDKDGGIKVDGLSIWGTDGEVPHRTLSISVSIDGKAVALPAEATRDLFEPNMETLVLLAPPQPSGATVVLMQNSDGAGAYCVVWSFANGCYTGRTVFSQD